MRVRSIFLCMAAAAAFSGCWLPPFDPELSASQITIEKLGAPVWSARVTLGGHDRKGWYLPSKEPALYSQGVWVTEAEGVIALRALRIEGGQGHLWFLSGGLNFLGRARLLSMPRGSGGSNYIFIAFEPSGIRSAGTTPGWLWDMEEASFHAVGMAPGNLGEDWYFMARWDARNITVHSAPMDSGTPMPATPLDPPTLSFPSPTSFTGPGFFVHSPATGFFYLSGPTIAGLKNYIWRTDTDPPVRLPITRQLTGILSDGRLLANGGDELHVYGPEGAPLFTIRTGYLRFVHERFHSNAVGGGRWISVFTRTVPIPMGGGGISEHLIEIFEIPTADLRKLAD